MTGFTEKLPMTRVMKAIKYNKRKLLMVLLPALVVALALLVPRSLVTKPGNEQWDKTFGGLGCYDVSYSVDQTSDGGYIVTGWTRSYGAGRDDLWLIKVGVNPAESTADDK